MAKNTTIFTLLSNFISQEEITGILVELGFEDTARKCDVPTLLAYLVGAATFIASRCGYCPSQGLNLWTIPRFLND